MYLEIGNHATKHAQKVICKKDFPSFCKRLVIRRPTMNHKWRI